MKKIIIIFVLLASYFFTVPTYASITTEELRGFGDVTCIALPASAALITLLHKDYVGFGELVEGVAYTQLITEGLKYSIDAKRPNGGSKSFPSGHAAGAMSGAAFIQFKYGYEFGIPAYAIASLVAYSRVASDRHYWRDVIASTVLATGIQYVITKKGYSLTDILIAPYFTKDSTGVQFYIKF